MFSPFSIASTLLYAFLVFPPRSLAISTGAPDLACPTMTPGHGPPPQSGSPAVKMVLDRTAVAPGEKVKVKLEATSATPFKVREKNSPIQISHDMWIEEMYFQKLDIRVILINKVSAPFLLSSFGFCLFVEVRRLADRTFHNFRA